MDDFLTRMYPVSYLNKAGLAIPPYAIIQLYSDIVTDTENPPHNFRRRLIAQQYDGDDGPEQFQTTTIQRDKRILAINGPFETLPDKYGWCSFAKDYPAWCRIETNDSYNTDAGIDFLNNLEGWVGVEMGPKAVRWGLCAGGYGFIVLSQPDKYNLNQPDTQRVLVQQLVRTQRTEWLVSAETTTVLGPYQTVTGHLPTQGKCCVIDPLSMTLVSTEEFDIDTSGIGNHMLFPGKSSTGTFTITSPYICQGYARDGVYYATNGGTDSFIGTFDGGTYNVTPTFPTQDNIDPVTCLWWNTYASLVSGVGHEVLVELIGGIPYIVDSRCPPTS